MNRLLAILSLWTAMCSQLMFSQEVPRVINFSGTSQQLLDKTWMIAEDSNHMMYFANTEGLFFFDGSEWKNYTLPNKQVIRSVAIDHAGRIFTGAYGEFGYWERNQRGRLQYISLSESIRDEIAHTEEIWHILVRKDYVLFQSFATIFKYNYQKIELIRPPNNHTAMFFQLVRGRDIIQVKQKGLFELLPDASFQMLRGTEALAALEVVCILPYKENGLLIGTSLNGVFVWENGRLKNWELAANEVLAENQLNKGIRLSSGLYAFGTILNGLYILDIDGNIQWSLNREQGLQNNTILSMWEDQQRNLWLGLDKGIDLVELNSELIFYPDFDGFLGTVYAAVVHENTFYVGTNHGVYMRDWRENKDQARPFQFLAGSQGQVWQLKVFDGQLLCGHNEGTFRIENNKWEKISSVTGGWVMISSDKHPDKLIQGTYTGLIIFEKDHNGKWEYAHRLDNLRDPIKQIVFDKEGFLWAQHPYKGLYRLNVDDSLQNIQDMIDISAENGLPSVFDLEVVKIGGEVLIHSKDRFYKFNHKTLKLQAIDSLLGHPIHSVDYSLLSGRGDEFIKVYPNSIELIKDTIRKVFSVSLVSDYVSIISLDSQKYLLGLPSGYAIYDESREENITTTAALQPMITSVCLVEENDADFCIDPFKRTEDPFQFQHDQNYLRFSFSYPDYSRTHRFRYQLEGFSENMSDWSDEHFKEYSNLNPGEYTFRVQSQVSDSFAHFHFVILPAWYQTIWARILFGLAIVGLLIVLVRLLAHRLEMERRKKEKLRQQELQRQLIEARNEKLQLEVLGKSQELANSTMSLVKKNEILLKIKEEIKNIRSEFDQGLPYKYYKRMLSMIDGNITNEHDWQVFETNFNQVHDQFFKRLKSDLSRPDTW